MNKQKWLKQEVEELGFSIRHLEDNEQTEQSLSVYINNKKDFIIFDFLSDTIDLPKVQFLWVKKLKRLIEIAEQYKNMEK